MREDREVVEKLGTKEGRAEWAGAGVVEEETSGGLKEEGVGGGVHEVWGNKALREGCDVRESGGYVALVGPLGCEISQKREAFCVDCRVMNIPGGQEVISVGCEVLLCPNKSSCCDFHRGIWGAVCN